MNKCFIRQEMLIGSQASQRLANSHIAIFGIGGVGSYVTEALARAGVGRLTLIDSDVVDISNINRQLIALQSTIGQPKVEVMRRRILDINPNAEVQCCQMFYGADNLIDLSQFDYIADAIDSVSSKLLLIENAFKSGIPIISSMGTGNKLDPTRLEVCDIYSTSVCPLARVMRRELKKRGITRLKTVYSKEEPIKPDIEGMGIELPPTKWQIPGSISFVPSSAGLIIAGEIIKDIISPDFQSKN